MRHRVRGRKLGRTHSHRKALLRNLASSLIEHYRITTTDAKAKELRKFVEPLVTMAKRGTMASRREILKKLGHKIIVTKLFKDVAPQFANRPGGYTRILKLGYRRSDNAMLSMIEFVGLSKPVLSEGDSKKKGKEKDKAAEKVKSLPAKK